MNLKQTAFFGGPFLSGVMYFNMVVEQVRDRLNFSSHVLHRFAGLNAPSVWVDSARLIDEVVMRLA